MVLGTKGKLKGKPMPDSSLRDTENISLSEDVNTYFQREVLPHAPDAWIDESKKAVSIDYRPVHSYTMTNEVSYIAPKARVY